MTDLSQQACSCGYHVVAARVQALEKELEEAVELLQSDHGSAHGETGCAEECESQQFLRAYAAKRERGEKT